MLYCEQPAHNCSDRPPAGDEGSRGGRRFKGTKVHGDEGSRGRRFKGGRGRFKGRWTWTGVSTCAVVTVALARRYRLAAHSHRVSKSSHHKFWGAEGVEVQGRSGDAWGDAGEWRREVQGGGGPIEAMDYITEEAERGGATGTTAAWERNGGKCRQARELEGSSRMSRGLSRREAGDGYNGSTGGLCGRGELWG